jgi:hypothetical protein
MTLQKNKFSSQGEWNLAGCSPGLWRRVDLVDAVSEKRTVSIFRATWYQNPEDYHPRHHENLKSHRI